MIAPTLIPLILGLVLLMSPGDLLDALGSTTDWERDLLRFGGAFLALHGAVTLSASHVRGIGYGDPVLSKLSTVAIILGAAYLIRGDSLFLVIAFSLIVGISLNRSMKRLELAYERAQIRVDPRRGRRPGEGPPFG